MSLFKSLTGLAKATYQLAKEDKEFRKEYAIATVTFPITAGKAAFDALDNATGATKNFETVLDKVDSITGVEFDWNAREAGLNYKHLEGHDVGVIAQSLQEILPEAVKTREDGYLAVDYSRVVPLLIQAIKELKAKIEEK